MTGGVPPLPDFLGGSLADVLPAVMRSLGAPDSTTGSEAIELPEAVRVCVVLVDGLGMNALLAHPQQTPFLTSLLGSRWSRRITSVFPTTTPVALTSLGTGLPPGEHGVTGLVVRMPADGRLVNTLAIPAQTDMRRLQPQPTVFETLAAAGVAVTRVGPGLFDGKGLTEAGLRGGDYSAAESVGERVAAVSDAVRRARRTFTYVYFGDLDATGHRRGCRSAAWREELAHLDQVVERLAAAMPAGAALVVTSDHGMVDVDAGRRWDLAVTPALAEGVESLAGDTRGVHVHARPGAVDDVATAWSATLGPDFWVWSRDEAVACGLYGPVVADHVRPRIGDVVAAARGESAVVDSRVMPASLLGLVGLHGSLTADELFVPLLVQHVGNG